MNRALDTKGDGNQVLKTLGDVSNSFNKIKVKITVFFSILAR